MAEPSVNIARQDEAGGRRPLQRPHECQALELLAGAFQAYERIAVSFSGAEDVVLIDLGTRIVGPDLMVFSLDTGRLHPETHRFVETVRDHYGVAIETLAPDPGELARLVRDKGLFSFYRDGHEECCAVRKIGPLARKLRDLDAWITGQRADQSVTREGLPMAEDDLAFSAADHPIRKFNPLADWTGADVWDYIRRHQVPYNPLHDQGFRSIGCEPCTRPVGPTNTSARGAGGGNTAPPRNAACTPRTSGNRFGSWTASASPEYRSRSGSLARTPEYRSRSGAVRSALPFATCV